MTAQPDTSDLKQFRTALVYGSEPIHYATPAMRIGQHWWACIVYTDHRDGRCTLYVWRCVDCCAPFDCHCGWRRDCAWPAYNGDDGMYAGLPRSLRKLYDRHKAEIEAALAGSAAGAPSKSKSGYWDHDDEAGWFFVESGCRHDGA